MNLKRLDYARYELVIGWVSHVLTEDELQRLSNLLLSELAAKPPAEE